MWVDYDESCGCVVVCPLQSTVASGVTVIDTPEVIEAADAVEAKLPHPVPGNNWGTVKDRMDDVMRTKLRDMFGVV